MNVINAAKNFIEEQAGNEVTLLTIGRKAHDALVRAGAQGGKILWPCPGAKRCQQSCAPISTYLMEAFIAERYDRVYLLYSKFVNVLKLTPRWCSICRFRRLTQAERKKYLRMCTDFHR